MKAVSEGAGNLARLLFCCGCAGEGRVPIGDVRDETRTVKWGAMAHPGVRCDRCSREFSPDELVAAVSVYDRPGDYWPWEGFYFLACRAEESSEERSSLDGRSSVPAGWSEIEAD